jgi:uncharacterized membrane protein required for colicin V production
MSEKQTESFPKDNDPSQGWGAIDVWSLALFFPVMLWAMLAKDYVLATAWCLVCLCGCSGLRAGAAGMLGMFVAMGIAIVYGPFLGIRYEGEVTKWLGTTGLANRLISISVMVMMMTLLIGQVFQWVILLATYKHKTLQGVNRYVGGVLGCVQGVAGVFLLIGGLFTIESLQKADAPINNVASNIQIEATSVSLLGRVVNEAHASRLGSWVKQYNPYEKIPQLNRFHEVKRTVEMLVQPDRVQELLAHPEVVRLKSDPQVQQAMRDLRDDPEISKLLQGSKALDSAAILMLMNHPKVLNLLDQPGFLESARRALK